MAGIPLFTNDFLSSPTMFGAIAPSTARLMAETGARIGKQIEENSLRLEAQAKAPQVAGLYAQGMKLISEGDMSGFALLGQSIGQSGGNPLLSKMSGQAISEGARMANSYMDNTMATERIKQQANNQNALLDRQEENQRALFDRQQADDYRSRLLTMDKEYDEQVKAFQKDQAGKKRQAELEGREFTPEPPPSKPAYPPAPEPMSRTFSGGNPNALFDGANDEPLPLSQDLSAQSETGAPTPKGTPIPRAQAVPTALKPELPQKDQFEDPFQSEFAASSGGLPPDKSSTLSATQETKQPLVNEKEKPFTLPVGNAQLIIPGYKGQAPVTNVSETVQTGTGSKTYTTKGEGSDASKLVESVAKMSTNDPSFSEWVSIQALQGKDIGLKEVGEGKAVKYQPYIKNKDGSVANYGKLNPAFNQPGPDGKPQRDAPQTIDLQVDKETGDAFKSASELMKTSMKGKFQLLPNLNESQTKQGIESIKQGIAAGQYTLEKGNEYLEKMGLPKLTKADIQALKKAEKPLVNEKPAPGAIPPPRPSLLEKGVGALQGLIKPKSRIQRDNEEYDAEALGLFR